MQVQITSAVININGKEYEGKNHAEAILKAQADGQDISQVDRQSEGLFKLSDGTIINREQAKEQFGQDRSELIIPQDEASNQANVEYKRIQDEQANTITPTEPINAGQELNNGAGIQQADGNGGEIQQGDGIGQVSVQEVPKVEIQKEIDDIEKKREEEFKSRDDLPSWMMEEGVLEYRIEGEKKNIEFNKTSGNPISYRERAEESLSRFESMKAERDKINQKYDLKIAKLKEEKNPTQAVPTEKVEEGVTPGLKDVESTDKALEGVDTFHLVENEGEWKATTKTYRGREIGNWAISNLDKKQQKEYLKIRDEADTYGTKEQAEENLKKLKDFEQKNKEAFERAKQEIDALKEAEERKAEERKKQQNIFDQTENVYCASAGTCNRRKSK